MQGSGESIALWAALFIFVSIGMYSPAIALGIFVAFIIWLVYLFFKVNNEKNVHARLAVNNEADAAKQLKRTYDKNFPEMTEKQKWVCIDKFIEECYKDGTFSKKWRK